MVKNTELLKFAVMNVTKIIIHFCFCCALLCPKSAIAAAVVCERYPEGKQCTSPDGRFTIENINSLEEPHHLLNVKDNKTNTIRKLYSYEREASLVWSPDSTKLILNDYAGSDYTINLIFSITKQKPILDLRKSLIQKMPKFERKRAIFNDHVYVSGLEWIGNQQIMTIVWGHGDHNPKGFCECYIFSVNGNTSHCKTHKHKNCEDAEEVCERLKK